MAEIKISDLSIGDWVEIDGAATKVWYLSEDSEINDTTYDWVKPIPITPEILEKNGFEEGKRYDGLDVRVFSNGNISVSIPQYAKWNRVRVYDDEGLYELSSAIIYYVHQLQHALRLAGVEKEIEV